MAVSKQDLIIDQGSDFSRVMTITSSVTNLPVNLVGYTFASQMRVSASAVANTAFLMSSPDAANGRLSMSMSSANTALLTGLKYVYDVEIRSSANIVSRVVEGMITVNANVTR